jgi:hypothetical protein
LKIAEAESIWREYGLDFVLAGHGYAKSRNELMTNDMWMTISVSRLRLIAPSMQQSGYFESISYFLFSLGTKDG